MVAVQRLPTTSAGANENCEQLDEFVSERTRGASNPDDQTERG
jgi:hypothetical protein